MMNYAPLNVLPTDIQQDWMAGLQRQVSQQAQGHFYLVNIRRTKPKSFEEQRVIVLVVDENGFPIPNVPVAFSYSTADQYVLTPDFLWTPPSPPRAFIVPTAGSGQIDQIQGSGVKQGQPGGITVYLFEPEYSSDVVTGLGMLADHTGLHLTFQLRRNGVTPLMDRIASLEARVAALEAG
ncbi:MAG: hypothetical protein Fur0044_14650 [Anaerolineae bacterium]|jgi:hypothetical protein|nr:hypothetical protein [Anaerolineales bacterium]MCQ3973121.1 hypothetical protein [Anaerolineae bacterium]